MEPVQQLQHAVQAFHYVAPAVVLLYYLITAMVTICTLQTTDAKDQRAPRKLIIFGMLVVILTYVSIAARTMNDKAEDRFTKADIFRVVTLY